MQPHAHMLKSTGCQLLGAWLVCALLTGCTVFSRSQRDLDNYNASVTQLNGTLASEVCSACGVLVVAMDARGQPLSYKQFERAGSFEMLISSTAQSVFAFHDNNNNLQYDPGEPFAWQLLPAPGLLATTLNLRRAAAQPVSGAQPQGSLFALRNKLIADIDVQLGTRIALQDPRLGPDKAALGMWQPMAFMREGLAGIYFLESYDPNKIPVLFVHGIYASPRDFDALVQRIDRHRYQPWLLYYPTGLEVPVVSAGLLGLLNELWTEHRFRELHLVAHSMGGLVVRDFLNACMESRGCSYVRSSTSISTPFGGDIWAQAGIKHSPVVLPVWHSMSPEGAFLGSLFARPLSDDLPHHLVFGYRNTSRVSSRSGDGTIPLESQLRAEAQQQAVSLRGFDENHTSILTNPQLGDYLNAIFDGRVGQRPTRQASKDQ